MERTFPEYLAAHAAEVTEAMAGCYRDARSADLERYLYGPLAAFCATGGKRHRPLICMLAARAVGGSAERARVAATAIEHFQSGALIHDDIADHGKLRRGAPCMYLTEGVGPAINCGDLELALTTGVVIADDGLDDATKVRVLSELSAMTVRTIEGQALDLGWVRDGRFDLTVDDYLTMATLKTAHYSGGVPLAVGAIVGGGDDEQVEALRSFGLDSGLAFQIQDDLINIVGSDREKDWRSDITEGKRTLVAVHALQHAEPALRDELERILASGTEDPGDLDRAVEILEATGSIAYARDHARHLIDRAKETLAGVELDEGCQALLISMADFFVERLK